MIDFSVSEADAGRILTALRRRQKDLVRGVTKFGKKFDPILGANMTEALREHDRLIESLEEQIS